MSAVRSPRTRALSSGVEEVSLAAPASQAREGTSGEAPQGMVWIPGGEFWMGSDDAHMVDARPVHRVAVRGFWMDKTEVTNVEFLRFVEATGYVTVAERPPRAEDFPGAPPEQLKAGSILFSPPDRPVSLHDPYVWWRYVPGASFRHPEGPGSNVSKRGRRDRPGTA